MPPPETAAHVRNSASATPWDHILSRHASYATKAERASTRARVERTAFDASAGYTPTQLSPTYHSCLTGR